MTTDALLKGNIIQEQIDRNLRQLNAIDKVLNLESCPVKAKLFIDDTEGEPITLLADAIQYALKEQKANYIKILDSLHKQLEEL